MPDWVAIGMLDALWLRLLAHEVLWRIVPFGEWTVLIRKVTSLCHATRVAQPRVLCRALAARCGLCYPVRPRRFVRELVLDWDWEVCLHRFVSELAQLPAHMVFAGGLAAYMQHRAWGLPRIANWAPQDVDIFYQSSHPLIDKVMQLAEVIFANEVRLCVEPDVGGYSSTYLLGRGEPVTDREAYYRPLFLESSLSGSIALHVRRLCEMAIRPSAPPPIGASNLATQISQTHRLAIARCGLTINLIATTGPPSGVSDYGSWIIGNFDLAHCAVAAEPVVRGADVAACKGPWRFRTCEDTGLALARGTLLPRANAFDYQTSGRRTVERIYKYLQYGFVSPPGA